MPEDFVKVANTGEVSPGEMKLIRIDEESILLVNLDGTYYAVEGECPHAFAYLSYGQLYGEEVMCPLHGSAFNIKTGAVLSPPSPLGLAVYQVRIVGDEIHVGPPSSSANRE